MPIRLPHAAALLLATTILLPAPAVAGPMTPGERQRLIAHLEMTESWLASEVEGLSDAQLTFKSALDKWSVKDVVEHLAIAEPQYWTNLQDSLKEPVKAGYKPQATDEQMLWYGIDRTNRQKTGEARVPHGQFPNAQASLASFRKLRKTMLETAKSSQEDFRGRPFMGGGQDIYQWFLMISTHAQRHILQIREIKADPGYPKK
jgi:DinB family protein